MKRQLQFSIQWHITSKCQNHCKHCYMYNSTYEQKLTNECSYEDLMIILGKLDLFENKYDCSINEYAITGGDPFEHPAFYSLLGELNNRGKNIYILGIPERITEDSIKELTSLGVLHYQLSLDGLKDMHDECRGKGSFDRTIQALEILNQSKMSTSIMFTLYPGNQDEMFSLIDELDKRKIRAGFSFDLMIFEGNARSFKDQVFLPDQIKTVMIKYLKKKEELEESGSSLLLNKKLKLFNVLDYQNKPNAYFFNDQCTFCGGCYNGIYSLSIDSDGSVYPCRRLPLNIGNLKKDSFESVLLNNDLLKKFRRRKSYSECGQCKYFKICRGCAAYSYSVYGDAFQKPPYCFLFDKDDNNELEKEDAYDDLSIILNTDENLRIHNIKSHFLLNKSDLLKELIKHHYYI